MLQMYEPLIGVYIPYAVTVFSSESPLLPAKTQYSIRTSPYWNIWDWCVVRVEKYVGGGISSIQARCQKICGKYLKGTIQAFMLVYVAFFLCDNYTRANRWIVRLNLLVLLHIAV